MAPNSIPSVLMAEKKSGIKVRPAQGGFNKGGVTASAGTHDGSGALDISVSGWSNATINKMVLWMRRCGWAAWHRYYLPNVWGAHIHCIRIGDGSASSGAKAQVISYKNGRNGLAGNGKDGDAHVAYVTWENCKYNPKNAPKPATPYVINGKKYAHLSFMDVSWINDARKAKTKYVSRPVHRLQYWLSYKAAGAYYHGPKNGIWNNDLQKALDSYRKNKMHLKGSDATGPVGLSSLKHIAKAVKSPYKVQA